METEIRCPYCNSKDLAKQPPSAGTPDTTVYKCQMCSRTFSKTPAQKED